MENEVLEIRTREDFDKVQTTSARLARVPEIDEVGVIYSCPGVNVPYKIFAYVQEGEFRFTSFDPTQQCSNRWDERSDYLFGERGGFEGHHEVTGIGYDALKEYGLLPEEATA